MNVTRPEIVIDKVTKVTKVTIVCYRKNRVPMRV